MPEPTVLLLLSVALATTAIGAAGGIGGAILLVSILALTGTAPADAAPLGLASVAAGSIAAGATQLRARRVNHRLGITTELAATTGATVGALVAGAVAGGLITAVLAAAAALAAVSMLRPTGATAKVPDVPASAIGEWPGQIAGATPPESQRSARPSEGDAPTDQGIDADDTPAAVPDPASDAGDGLDADAVAYRARHLPLGLVAMALTGLMAGVSGAGGGFIKTPVTSDLMRIPTRVAAATTTFTVGVTSAAGLVVMSVQGRIDPRAAAAVIAGSLIGGRLGARAQEALPSQHIRRGLGVVLLVVAVLLVVRR